MSYCTKCGKQIIGMEKFCTNCGNPLSSLYTNNHISPTEKSTVSSCIVWTVVLVAGFLFLVFLSSQNSDSLHQDSTSKLAGIFDEKVSQEKIQAIKDVNKMRRAIDNTIWTYTERGNLI